MRRWLHGDNGSVPGGRGAFGERLTPPLTKSRSAGPDGSGSAGGFATALARVRRFLRAFGRVDRGAVTARRDAPRFARLTRRPAVFFVEARAPAGRSDRRLPEPRALPVRFRPVFVSFLALRFAT
jgi:hypothetical protein